VFITLLFKDLVVTKDINMLFKVSIKLDLLVTNYDHWIK